MKYSECVSVALVTQHVKRLDWDSVVGITTRYKPDGPGIESRCEARFSAPFQTSPVAHPSSCTMGTRSPSRGIKQPERGADHPFPSSVEVTERVYPHIYSPLCASMAYSRARAVICGISGSITFFSTLYHKRHAFRGEKLLNKKRVLILSATFFSETCSF